MAKKKILVLCAHARDMRELSKPWVNESFDIIYEPLSKEWLNSLCYEKHTEDKISLAVDTMCSFIKKEAIDAVISTPDYPANIMRAAITEALQLQAPSLNIILSLEHKYYARLLQQHHMPALAPEFQLIARNQVNSETIAVKLPIIIKPVKSSFGRGAFKINNMHELLTLDQSTWPSAQFLLPFNYFLKKMQHNYDSSYLLAESFLSGYMTTVEGFVFEGNATVFAIVDALLFPDSISFMRFEYPSLLAQSVQKRMAMLIEQFMEAIGFNYGFFNVECIYNPETDTIHIIEINPRISNQFADLYERVDGFNTYRLLLELCIGKKPTIMRNEGKFKCAASCVLRSFKNYFVERLPSQHNLAYIKELFPDATIEIFAHEGALLSAVEQDDKSFRYGLINIGGYDREDLLNRFEIIKNLLQFRFRETSATSAFLR